MIARCFLACVLASAAAAALAQQYACTNQGGIAAAEQDERIRKAPGGNYGWAPRTWMAWCRQCNGTVSSGRCVGAKLDGQGGGSSGGASTPEQAAVNAAQSVMNAGNFNTMNNAAMTTSAALATGLAVGALQNMMQGPSPQELQRRELARQEEARRQQTLAEQRRREEEERHRNLVAGLRGTGDGGQLALRREGSGGSGGLSDLRRGDAAATPIGLTPFGAGSVTPQEAMRAGENLSLLRRGDGAPAQSALDQLAAAAEHARAGQTGLPFDDRAQRLGALPPAPPTPEGRPVLSLADLDKPGPKPRQQVAEVLNSAIADTKQVGDSVKKDIARLEAAPQRDEAKIREEREKLARIEQEQRALEDKKKKVDESKDEMIDLSIKDLAGEATR